MSEAEKLRYSRSSRSIGQHKEVCPFCSHLRKKKTEKTLSVMNDGQALVYHCWHCEAAGKIGIEKDDRYQYRQREREPLMVISTKEKWSPLSEEMKTYLYQRGISERVAKSAGLRETDQYISKIGSKTRCLVFPYRNKGAAYSAKIRSIEAKGFACAGSPQTMFNLDRVPEGSDLIICEGEMDQLSFEASGIDYAASVPNGAVMKVMSNGNTDMNDNGKFRFLWNAKDKLESVSRVIIATDADSSGEAMAEEIARRVGKDKCWKVEYPEGCKDANDVLVKLGKKSVKSLIENAIPWPVAGLYDAAHFESSVDDMYQNGIAKGASTGYPSLDELYTVVGGQLTVVTGHPSSGKSEMVDQIIVNLAENHGWKTAICSFENEPRLHIAKLISKYIRKPFFEGPTERISVTELQRGKEFVQKHFSFIYQADGTLSTIDSIIERMKIAVLRHGVRGVVIDPYNYIARSKGSDKETDWISDMLTKLRVFAQAHGLHIWFVAHPQKMQRDHTGKVPPPRGYDISGCYDSDTEVLTSDGWIRHEDVTMDCLVACYDKDNSTIKYDRPEKIHKYDHNGIMHHWSGSSLDIMVTPNHRMVAKRKPNDKFEFVKSEDITKGRWYFPSSAGLLPVTNPKVQKCRSIQTDRNLQEVEYSGRVYCLTVPTGAYVTRRNGKVAFQGNSAAWFSKPDVGITVHRDDSVGSTVAQILIWKVRFSWVGRQGSCDLAFDIPTSTYNEIQPDSFMDSVPEMPVKDADDYIMPWEK